MTAILIAVVVLIAAGFGIAKNYDAKTSLFRSIPTRVLSFSRSLVLRLICRTLAPMMRWFAF